MFEAKYLVDAAIVVVVALICAKTWESSQVKLPVKLVIVGILLVVGFSIINVRHDFFNLSSPTSEVTAADKTTLKEVGQKAVSLAIRLAAVLLIGVAIFMVGPVKYWRNKTKPELIAVVSLVLIGISLFLVAFWSAWWLLLTLVGYLSGCGGFTVPIRNRGTPTFHGRFDENVVWDFGLHFWFWPIWYVGSGMILTPYETMNKNVITEWLQTKAKADPSRSTPQGSGAAIRVKYTLYTKVGVMMVKLLGFNDYTAEAMFGRVKDLVDAWLDSELKGMDYDDALNHITNLEMPESVKIDILRITGCKITTFKVNDRDPDPLVAAVYSQTVVMEAEQRQLELQKILSRLRGEASGEEEAARLEVIGRALRDEDNVRALNALRSLTLVRSEGTKWVIPDDVMNLAGLLKAR